MNLWDEIWNKDTYSNKKVRNRKSTRKLKKYIDLGINFKKYNRIVDFGAGGGYVTLELLRINPNIHEILLIDNSLNGLERAKDNLNEWKNKNVFLKQDLNFPIYNIENKYDLAIAFSILEHLENIESGIDNIYRTLKTKGEVIMIWSNKKSIFHLQHVIFEKLGIWRYGLTKEIEESQIDFLIKDKFEIVSKKIEPCVGDKGILTIIDNLMHICFHKYGRYIFLRLQKVE